MAETASPLFIGLMSGTSVDGVDAALVTINSNPFSIRLLAAHCEPVTADFRARILALTQPGGNEIDRLGPIDVEIGRLFARASIRLLADAGIKAEQVTAIGSHGQTLRHRALAVATPFTLQAGDPNTIAELTGITTVADFRRRDIAAGGQGAPLVPAFHAAVFRNSRVNRMVVNIGGMANVTLLPMAADGPVSGFDTGPGNVLLDAWHERHRGTPVDLDGAWARSGHVDGALLDSLMADPFLGQLPPKSTGREQYSIERLDMCLTRLGHMPEPRDVQATLLEFTARSIAEALLRWGHADGDVFLCGGGAHNTYLRERLACVLGRQRLATTAELGVDPDWVEAMAFAWLAQRTLACLPGNLPAVTGARHPVILGGIYPGGHAARIPASD